MNKRQGGFTLIELVVVIVILGILAAFAVPRFMGMEGEARASTVKNFAGTLRAAAAMARAKCQAQDCGAAGTVVVDGQNVVMQNGYPNRDSIALVVDITQAGFTTAANGANGMRFTKTGGGVNCWVQYNQSTNVNVGPTITYGAGTYGSATFNRNFATNCSG